MKLLINQPFSLKASLNIMYSKQSNICFCSMAPYFFILGLYLNHAKSTCSRAFCMISAAAPFKILIFSSYFALEIARY
jgi:hypothetical protein